MRHTLAVRSRGWQVAEPGALTGIAVEVRESTGLGRCRMLPLADASAESLHPFVTDHVEPRATVITDGWQGYSGLEQLGYVHDRRSQRAARARGEDPGELLLAVHRVASLAKRWLLGTHQGSVEPAHMASYLNEFVFRLQPPGLPQPRDGLLPGAGARRCARPGALPGPSRHPAAPGSAAQAAAGARTPAEPRTPSRDPPLENGGPELVRLNGYPRRGRYPRANAERVQLETRARVLPGKCPTTRSCPRSGREATVSHPGW